MAFYCKSYTLLLDQFWIHCGCWIKKHWKLIYTGLASTTYSKLFTNTGMKVPEFKFKTIRHSCTQVFVWLEFVNIFTLGRG